MNSTVTNSLNFSNLESPKSNSSSLFGDSLFRWRRTPEKSLSFDEEEYGGIETVEYSEPFVIKFHNISNGERVNGQQKMNVVCQFDGELIPRFKSYDWRDFS
uniref:Ig-like domain-containing protein n=1 Tax=Caenorhabditis tropicalis TaxID=1561998 RepID=A0A1I7UMY0_9PELO